MVKTSSNALGDSESYFTTLATIAECNRAIIKGHFPAPVVKPFIVDDAQKQNMYLEKIDETWEHLTQNIEQFADMLADKTPSGDSRRQEIRQDYLLGKPVPQLCLFKAFVSLTASNNFALADASGKLNQINWQKNAKIWDRLLMSGGKILTKNAAIATEIICYVAGGKFDGEEKSELLDWYKTLFPLEEQPKIKLPAKI